MVTHREELTEEVLCGNHFSINRYDIQYLCSLYSRSVMKVDGNFSCSVAADGICVV